MPSREDGYRMRARLHRQGARLGFFREGTHEVCDARPTRQLLDTTCDALDAVAAGLDDVGARGVREVEIAENVDATLRVVYLESSDPLPFSELGAIGRIAGMTGVLATAPTRPGAAPETRLIAGDPYVVDRVEVEGQTVRFRRHVRSFFQGNRHLLSDLVAYVATLASAASRVLDLYAGVGLFAVSIAAAHDAHVIAVEGDPFAVRDLEVNATNAAGAARASGARQVAVAHRTVEHYLTHAPAGADLVVVDPPRTGLTPEALRALIALRAPRLVYVSCDVATLARDVQQLVEAGGYQPDRIEAFDLFPNTPHVETVMQLRRP
jgi:23S rRNA (uracil1939-C5)-methyltransferase